MLSSNHNAFTLKNSNLSKNATAPLSPNKNKHTPANEYQKEEDKKMPIMLDEENMQRLLKSQDGKKPVVFSKT